MDSNKKHKSPSRNKSVASDSLQNQVQDPTIAKVWTSQEAYDDAWERFNRDMEGSGIDISLFHDPNNTSIQGFQFIDSEEETEGAIWDFLSYDKTTGNKNFGHQAKDYIAGWGIYQEDGSPWQCKPRRYRRSRYAKERVFGAKYYAPAGIGNKALFLPVSVQLRRLIGDRFGVQVPETGSFWEWLATHPDAKKIQLVITEGAKKAAAAFQLGIPAISLFGCHSGTQKVGEIQYKILTNELQPYCEGREVIVAFDKDDKKKTVVTVNRATRQLCKAIKRNTGTPLVMKWNSSEGKGLDDLIVNKGILRTNKCFKESVSIERWDNDQLTKLGQVDKVIKSRYVGVGLNIEQIKKRLYKHKVLAMKSQYGTGKSYFMAQLIDSIRDDYEKIQILNLTHRNRLGETISKTLGIVHGKGTKEQKKTIEYQYATILGSSMCGDSMCPEGGFDLFSIPWEDLYVNGLVIVIDEIEQFLKHILDSSTCKHRRVAILEQFLALFQLIRERDNIFLVVADNDLGGRAMNFIDQALNSGYEEETHIHSYVIHNTYSRDINRIAYRYKEREDLLRRIILGLTKGEKYIIHSASVSEEGLFSTLNIEEHLLKLFPTLKILRIDADTVIDPEHPAFGCMNKDLNQTLVQYDVVIASPVIETGVSIEPNGYFDAVFGFFQGIQPVDSVCQTIERCRDDIPRHIWVNQKPTFRNNTPDAAYAKESYSYWELLNYTKDRAVVNQRVIDCPAHQLIDDDYPFLKETWAAYKAEQVWMIQDYRTHVYRKMEEENGYTFCDPDDDPTLRRKVEEVEIDIPSSEEIYEEHKIVVQESTEKRREETLNAEDLKENEYKVLFKQRKKTKKERRALDKYHIKQMFCLRRDEQLTEQHIKQYDKGVLSGWYGYYYTTKGERFLQHINNERVKGICKNGKAFAPDVNKESVYMGMQILHRALLPFIERLGENLTSGQISDIYLEHIVQNKAMRTALWKFLGIKSTDNAEQAVRVTKPWLARLGYTMICTGRKKGEQRTYMITIPDDGREEVLQRWYERDMAKYQDVLAS